MKINASEWKCINCSEEIDYNSMFCSICGKFQIAALPQNYTEVNLCHFVLDIANKHKFLFNEEIREPLYEVLKTIPVQDTSVFRSYNPEFDRKNLALAYSSLVQGFALRAVEEVIFQPKKYQLDGNKIINKLPEIIRKYSIENHVLKGWESKILSELNVKIPMLTIYLYEDDFNHEYTLFKKEIFEKFFGLILSADIEINTNSLPNNDRQMLLNRCKTLVINGYYTALGLSVTLGNEDITVAKSASQYIKDEYIGFLSNNNLS
ncbi:MAG TPA: hypothetical protein VM077_04380 [Candidatus Limnocylindrales bacterium]|nr:hypothetical protein [Candidatus Limnocylindrales bacterium]